MRTLKADEIEIRIGQVGYNAKLEKGYATLLLYKTSRVDRQMLDEVYGEMNWQCRYEDHKGNLFCSIGVWDENKSQWVWKEDCGTESNTEKEKGEASDSFKRAGFRWGIGIELYTAPQIYVDVAVEASPYEKGKYKLKNPYELRGMYVSRITYTPQRRIKDLDIAIKGTVIWSTDRRKVGTKHE